MHPVSIAAGGTHSAVITARGELLTFGNGATQSSSNRHHSAAGSFGKLGHGSEDNVNAPLLIQYFLQNKIRLISVLIGVCYWGG